MDTRVRAHKVYQNSLQFGTAIAPSLVQSGAISPYQNQVRAYLPPLWVVIALTRAKVSIWMSGTIHGPWDQHPCLSAQYLLAVLFLVNVDTLFRRSVPILDLKPRESTFPDLLRSYFCVGPCHFIAGVGNDCL